MASPPCVASTPAPCRLLRQLSLSGHTPFCRVRLFLFIFEEQVSPFWREWWGFQSNHLILGWSGMNRSQVFVPEYRCICFFLLLFLKSMNLIYLCYSLNPCLETGMATHSNILSWRIPWTEGPGRLKSMGSQSRTHTGFAADLNHCVGGTLEHGQLLSAWISPSLSVPCCLSDPCRRVPQPATRVFCRNLPSPLPQILGRTFAQTGWAWSIFIAHKLAQ